MPTCRNHFSSIHFARTTCLAALAALPSVASAQWTATFLHPDGNAYSYATHVRAGTQLGGVAIGTNPNVHASTWNGSAGSWEVLSPDNAASSTIFAASASQQAGETSYAIAGIPVDHASLWSGTKESWLDLHPHSFPGTSRIEAMDESQQVGYFIGDAGLLNAALWAGTPESFINLHPIANPSAFASRAVAVHGNAQGGYVIIVDSGEFNIHASMWSGSAESWVDLHPAGAVGSTIEHVNERYQGGSIDTESNEKHAALWMGTPESCVDLTPTGTDFAYVQGLHADVQAGNVYLDGVMHAGLWKGTAASWVALTPSGSTSSAVATIGDGWQAGQAVFSDHGQAGVWYGTPDSWQDLHAALPPGYAVSNALDRTVLGSTEYVVGYAQVEAALPPQAVVWTRSVATSCAADCDGSGGLNIDDFICFQTLFALGDPAADCDASGQLNIDDFICFQTLFALGC